MASTNPKFEYLVIAGGLKPPVSFSKRLLRQCAKLVTVDSGVKHALQLAPRTLFLHVGDFDSATERVVRRARPATVIELPRKKNHSDLEFALRAIQGLKNQNGPIVVIGAHRDHENRSDHAFFNLCLLARLKKTVFSSEAETVFSTDDAVVEIPARKSFLFSVFAPQPTQVRIVGAEYSGKFLITPRSTIGLSNKTCGKTFKIKSNHRVIVFMQAPILSLRFST